MVENIDVIRYIGLNNICVEKDMYKLETLNECEIQFIKEYYKDSPIFVRLINNEFLEQWQLFCRSADCIEKEINISFENVRIQKGEDLQSEYEQNLTEKLKENLYSKSEEFLNNDNEKLCFLLFLFTIHAPT